MKEFKYKCANFLATFIFTVVAKALKLGKIFGLKNNFQKLTKENCL